jgi:hypothetical protein
MKVAASVSSISMASCTLLKAAAYLVDRPSGGGKPFPPLLRLDPCRSLEASDLGEIRKSDATAH